MSGSITFWDSIRSLSAEVSESDVIDLRSEFVKVEYDLRSNSWFRLQAQMSKKFVVSIYFSTDWLS